MTYYRRNIDTLFSRVKTTSGNTSIFLRMSTFVDRDLLVLKWRMFIKKLDLKQVISNSSTIKVVAANG